MGPLLLLVLTTAPNGFVITSPPSSAQLVVANHSPTTWRVALTPTGVSMADTGDPPSTGPTLPFAIERGNPKSSPLHVLAVDDGYLVGTDQGEFGGALDYYGKSGKRLTRLLDKNTQGVVRVGEDIVSLHGLNHLGFRGGSIHFWRPKDKGFEEVATRKLDAGPLCYAQAGDVLWVLLPVGLFKLSGRELSKELSLDVGSLYPTSLVVDASGDLWAGMRQYVLHLVHTQAGYVEEWLIKK